MSPAHRESMQHRADKLLQGGRVEASLLVYRQLGAAENARRLQQMGNRALASGNVQHAVSAFVAAGFLSLRRNRRHR